MASKLAPPTPATVHVLAMPTWIQQATAGTIAGLAQVCVGHPFDTIKVRLQTQPNPPLYNNATDCLKKTIAKEGIRGLYKGVTSPLMGIGFCNAILFTINGRIRNAIQGPDKERQLTLSEIATSGALTGAFMGFVNCPVELVKIRLQLQRDNAVKLYNGTFDAATKIYAQHNLRGLYRGITVNILRDMPSFATYFFVYEGAKRTLAARYHNGNTKQLLLPELLLAGGAAGIACWIPCYPQDVIKSLMQSDVNLKYRSSFHAIKTLITEQRARGMPVVRAFFKGFGPTMARAFPANAATFFAYEMAISAMDARDPDEEPRGEFN
ncbi:924_t:CDS:2 [Paraglomus occultum]|uniref:924_t:CDS:1 n=1 Tax=Paraglomus occultum TaxID=144539 RepID=A0A9N8ZP33_9GLOM|nr:924_t:CDS:2 [Paraglomus occultum]